MSQRQRPRLGILMPPIPIGWAPRMSHALMVAAYQAGWQPQVHALAERPQCLPNVDAFIAAIFTAAAAQVLGACGRPVVNIDGGLNTAPFHRVGVDFQALGRMAADHLANHGCVSVGIIYANQRHNSRRAAQSCAEALAERGLPAVPIPHDHFWRASIRAIQRHDAEDAAMRRALSSLPPGSGLFVWSESVALAVRELGPRWHPDPGGLRMLCGFDDPLLGAISPTVSAIAQPVDSVARQAVAVAGRLLAGDRSPPTTELFPPTGIIVRETTALGVGDPLLGRVIEALHRRPPPTIAALAHDLDLPRRTLERRFLAAYGESMGAVRNRLLATYARQQQAAGVSRTALAEACGYSRSDAFLRWLRRQSG